MAIGRLLRSLLAGGAAALALGAGGCTVYPSSVPAEPAFDTDVRPIFLAHCTRCHGNGPESSAPNINPGVAPNYDGGQGCPTTPTPVDLTGYCSLSGGQLVCPPSINAAGAGSSLVLIKSAINDNVSCQLMPPLPAPPLNDWELKVVNAWLAEPKPTCTNSPNPDPAARCPPPDGGM